MGIGPVVAGQGLSLCPFAAPGAGSFGRVRPQLAARRFLKQFHFDIFHTKSRRHIGMPVGAPVISCF
ncbi:hypothetical protein I7824_11160 [Burkholderia seminalis]|nr:hypothetical protein [Burkholderia seminalis]